MTKIIPVLLSGGSGARLWPLSRKSYPKQFSKVITNRTLFQQSALRVQSSSGLDFEMPLVVTHSDYRFIVAEQLKNCGINSSSIIIEPESKNTAPAILAASLYALQKNPSAILIVMPTDHVITNQEAFDLTVQKGIEAVDQGNIVTFGINPTRPETGYGYLETNTTSNSDFLNVSHFIEKPDKIAALDMLKGGNFLWNAGIFMFRAMEMRAAFQSHAPHLLRAVELAVDRGRIDLDFFRLDSQAWEACENISIDYAIMEKSSNLVAIPFSAGWSDLGDWESVWRELGPNMKGVVTSDNAHAIDCANVLLRSESENQQIVGLGLEDIIAIAMPDAVLVADKNQSQNLKKVVYELESKEIVQAHKSQKDHRPWGWFDVLTEQQNFKVKRIFVNPNGCLSLQSHKQRSEHWVIVQGIAKVTIGDKVENLSTGESVYVPLGVVHRLENPIDAPLILIEVQIGEYLGEDDIVRYEDIYSRNDNMYQ